jgi:hypothetical protein
MCDTVKAQMVNINLVVTQSCLEFIIIVSCTVHGCQFMLEIAFMIFKIIQFINLNNKQRYCKFLSCIVVQVPL